MSKSIHGPREGRATFWIFGVHAVRAALFNTRRTKHRLVATRNAERRIADAARAAGIDPEIADSRRFPVPLDPHSTHQGVAVEVEPLSWDGMSEICDPRGCAPVALLLDRVSDPRNTGAVLRSARVFGARAVIAPRRHSAPESGALAKSASGALELIPYLRVANLAAAMRSLADEGYILAGLDAGAETPLEEAIPANGPVAVVLGSEGKGLRELTRRSCHVLARIGCGGQSGSLNVSNAAAVSLYCVAGRRQTA